MDYYKILGLDRSANSDSITKAYRKLAKQYHPDRNVGDENAKIKYAEVSDAYDTLNDPIKKAEYDRGAFLGHAGFQQTYRPSGENPNVSKKYKVSESELNLIQCSFFGGTDLQGRNILIHLTLPKTDMERGCTHNVKWKKRDKCKTCQGYGSADLNKSQIVKCKACAGTGNIMQILGKQGSIYPKCDFCDGTGALDVFCKDCKGSGLGDYVIEEMVIDVPLGTPSGHQIILRGRGEAGQKGGVNGNLHVVVLEQTHKPTEIKN